MTRSCCCPPIAVKRRARWMADRAAILRAWLETRWAMAGVRSHVALERRQARLWRRMAPVVAATPALAPFAGKPLQALPPVSVATLRADFDRWNSAGLRHADALAAAFAAERGIAAPEEPALLPGGIAAGLSTGTSGTRGLFLADAAERARYVGQSLARLLGVGDLIAGKRILLCLRADSALYRDVGSVGRFAFRFVALTLPPDDRAAAIAAFDPQVLIAPPHVLAALGRQDLRLPSLERVFYGAEPMGDAERDWIAARVGVRPDPLYQATEGFLGAPCRLGTLHLNEHDMVIELVPVDGTDRFRPIVTDLRRTTQPIVRVMLDDLIAPLDGGCDCGAVTRAIRPVEGRIADIWRWDGQAICPRTVEDRVAAALGPAADWRATASPAGVVVEAEDGGAARAALGALLAARGIDRPVGNRPFRGHGDAPKRRRVRWIEGGLDG